MIVLTKMIGTVNEKPTSLHEKKRMNICILLVIIVPKRKNPYTYKLIQIKLYNPTDPDRLHQGQQKNMEKLL